MLGDFEEGKAATAHQLEIKTDYKRRLPVVLCALAHVDESRAREFAIKIRDMWQMDPRPKMHVQKTVKFMGECSHSPGSFHCGDGAA